MPPIWFEIIPVHLARRAGQDGGLQTFLSGPCQMLPLQNQQSEHLPPRIRGPQPPRTIGQQPIHPLLRGDAIVLAGGKQGQSFEGGIRQLEPSSGRSVSREHCQCCEPPATHRAAIRSRLTQSRKPRFCQCGLMDGRSQCERSLRSSASPNSRSRSSASRSSC